MKLSNPTAFVTKEGITVKVGQVWRDLDKRMNGRTVEVIRLGNMTFEGKVRIRSAVSRSGTERWLSVSRMHRHSTGWEIVRDVQDGTSTAHGPLDAGRFAVENDSDAFPPYSVVRGDSGRTVASGLAENEALELSREMNLVRDTALRFHGEQRYGAAPYRVHLESVVEVLHRFGFATAVLISAAWLHDVLEDTPCTADDLRALGVRSDVIDVVERVTDVAGATRAERKKLTYPRIAALREAVIVKLADRIANVEAGGDKREMYRAEHASFRAALFVPRHNLDSLWGHLDSLLAV